jgi:hypothetical protein
VRRRGSSHRKGVGKKVWLEATADFVVYGRVLVLNTRTEDEQAPEGYCALPMGEDVTRFFRVSVVYY